MVEELGRYTNQRIYIRDPRIAMLRVGGALSTRDVKSSLEQLKGLNIPVEIKESDGVLTLELSEEAGAKPKP